MNPSVSQPAVSVIPESRDDRAAQIIAAAYALLSEGGLEGLTIRAVLTRTGLARRAFYECFAGKDDLVLAVFEHTLKLAALQFREQAASYPDPLERIRAIVTGIVLGPASFAAPDDIISDRRSRALSREHLRLAESRPRDLEKALRPLLELITEQVSEGVDEGLLNGCDPALQAMLIYNLVATTTHTELLTQDAPVDRARRQQLADQIWEFCRRAIVA